MKTIYRMMMFVCVGIAAAYMTACDKNDDCSLDLTGDCMIEELSLDNYEGTIDLATRSIVVRLPEGHDASRMTVTSLKISDGATADIAQGQVLNMESAQAIRVSMGDLYMDWNLSILHDEAKILSFVVNDIYTGVINEEDKTITVYVPGSVDVKTIVPTIEVSKKALFVGAASDMSKLDPEAQTACSWMLANAPEALAATNQLRTFRENGGALFLTRYATNLPSFIGVTGDDEWTTPNNCWGQNEDGAELCGGPWTFRIFDGQEGHPLWQNLIAGDNTQEVYCTDAGYHITNSTAQYRIGTDWGGYDDHAAWEARTGGKILGVGGDGAVVAWEYPATDGKGGIICIGSGCYDWYSYTYEAGYQENYHRNIAIITRNAFNYLTK